MDDIRTAGSEVLVGSASMSCGPPPRTKLRRVPEQTANRAASMKPWNNTTDDKGLAGRTRPSLGCFNEAMA
jgi:hypothetical protein